MAKDKILIDLLEEYKKNLKEGQEAYPYAIGCELHKFDYKTQLEFKKEHIRRLFAKKRFEIKLDTIHPSPIQKAYRNKMEYSFGDKEVGGELNLGMHVPGKFYDIESMTDLYIVDKDYNTLVEKIQAYARAKGYEKFHKRYGTGLLRHLIVRKGHFTGEILIGISTSYKEFDEEDFVKEVLKIDLEGQVVGIIRLKNDDTSDSVKKGPDDKILYGRDYYTEKILGLKFRVSFFSFFQTNAQCTQTLYQQVIETVKAENPKRVLDMFCGTGTISQLLSRDVEELVGIEIIEEAVEMARENAKRNKIENCQYICGDVFKVLKEKDLKADMIVVDPPRSGIVKKALEKIIALDVDKILYVSCNPRTLVVDYEILNQAGYKIEKIQAVDMYPHTKHVECIALMTRE